MWGHGSGAPSIMKAAGRVDRPAAPPALTAVRILTIVGPRCPIPGLENRLRHSGPQEVLWGKASAKAGA